MRSGVVFSVVGLLLLSACANTSSSIGKVPEPVAELADPRQDLSTARLLEEDGCYWYEHDGPVERTLLPLMSKRGRHICIQQQG